MTLVILSYNHPELTDRCVRSALAFFKPADVLLVHNGSESRWVKQHQKNFSEIEHLVIKDNKGFTGGANAGLKKSFEKDPWVLFLTNDCQLLTMPSIPRQNGFISPLIWARQVGRIDSLGGALNLRKGHLRHLKEAPENLHPQRDFFYIPGTAFWMHQEVFEATKGFDETLGTYWEDVDLSLKASRQKIYLGVDPKTEILHGIGKTCHSKSYYTTYLFQRNRKRVCLRHAQNRLEKSLVRWNLLLSWLSLALRKIQRRHWSSLITLAQAIKD